MIDVIPTKSTTTLNVNILQFHQKAEIMRLYKKVKANYICKKHLQIQRQTQVESKKTKKDTPCKLFIKHSEKKMVTILHKVFQKKSKNKLFPTHSLRLAAFLIPKEINVNLCGLNLGNDFF